MGMIKTAVITICCSSCVCGLIQMLCPKGSMSKIMKTVTGLFLLACILLPVSGTGFSLSDIDYEKELSSFAVTLDSQVACQQESITKRAFEATVQSLLSKGGYKAESVNISVLSGQDGNIAVTLVELTVDCSAEKAQEIRQYIFTATGIETTVIRSE